MNASTLENKQGANPLLIAAEGKLSQREFLTTLARLKAMPLLVAVGVATVAAILAACFIDIRWGIVALMLILIIAPGLMSFLYITYALSPRCLPAVHSHKVHLLPDALEIIYKVVSPQPAEESHEETLKETAEDPSEESSEESHEESSEDPSEDPAEEIASHPEPEERIVTLLIPREDITKVTPGLTHLLIEFRRPYGFLKIAYTRLPDPDLFLKNLQSQTPLSAK